MGVGRGYWVRWTVIALEGVLWACTCVRVFLSVHVKVHALSCTGTDSLLAHTLPFLPPPFFFQLGLPSHVLSGRDVHVHFPAGAVSKDGPSAGVAIVAALYSVFTGAPVPATAAMTGEITLAGNVCPVGGGLVCMCAGY